MIITGVVLIVLSLSAVIASSVGLLSAIKTPISETLSNPIMATPLKAAPVVMTQGTYIVYQKVDPAGGAVTLRPSQVHIKSPSGAAVRVSATNSTETLTRGQQDFRGAIRIAVPETGTYAVTVSKLKAPGQVIIGPSLSGEFAHAVGWVIGGIVGSLFLMLGILLLIIGLFRRRQARNRPEWVAPTVGPRPTPWQDDRAR